MKKIIIIFFILSLFALASCSSVMCAPSPVNEKQNDVISKPTNTVVAHDTFAEMPKGSWVRTDSDEKTQVVLEEDTVAFLKSTPKDGITEEPKSIVLPKNTPVILPENTYLQTSDQTKVKLEASTEVVLPVGTEITISKINWYAILFYALLVVLAAWYYLQSDSKDKDGDGFEDEEKSTQTTAAKKVNK